MSVVRDAAGIVIPVIVPRSLVIWLLIQGIVAALPLPAGGAFGSMPPSPVAVIALCGILGAIDIRVRGERLLWANLGMAPSALYATYAATALPGEILLALVRR